MEKWDTVSKKHNIPYYNLVNAGLHAFVYISLGNKFTYREVNAQKKKEIDWAIDVLPFEKCLKPDFKNSR